MIGLRLGAFLIGILTSYLSWYYKMSLIILCQSSFLNLCQLFLVQIGFALELFTFTSSDLSLDSRTSSSSNVLFFLIRLREVSVNKFSLVISFKSIIVALWSFAYCICFGIWLSEIILSPLASDRLTRNFFIFLLIKLIWTLTISILAVSLIAYFYTSVWTACMSRRTPFSLLLNAHWFANTWLCIQLTSIDLRLVLRKQTLISSFREIQRGLLDWFLNFSLPLSHLLYCLWPLGYVLVSYLDVLWGIVSLMSKSSLPVCVFLSCVFQS